MLCKVCKGQLMHGGATYAVGDEVDLDDESGARLVADGIVESVALKPKAKPKAKPKVGK